MNKKVLSNGDVEVAMSPADFVKLFDLDPAKYRWIETAQVYSFGGGRETKKYGYPYQRVTFSKKA